MGIIIESIWSENNGMWGAVMHAIGRIWSAIRDDNDCCACFDEKSRSETNGQHRLAVPYCWGKYCQQEDCYAMASYHVRASGALGRFPTCTTTRCPEEQGASNALHSNSCWRLANNLYYMKIPPRTMPNRFCWCIGVSWRSGAPERLARFGTCSHQTRCTQHDRCKTCLEFEKCWRRWTR